MSFFIGLGIGFAVGAAFPGVLRKIREYFQEAAEKYKSKM